MKTFEDLQSLGANVIHEQTHIARSKLELVLNKSFSELTRLQFMGFISILEREYGIDLSPIRDEYDEYVQEHPDVIIPKASVILQGESSSRRKWVFGGIIAIVVLIALGSIIQGRLSIEPSENIIKLGSSNVEVVDQNTDAIVQLEANTTVSSPVAETNVSVVKHELNVSNEPSVNFESAVSIKPIAKVWVGMMDLASGVKTQKITNEPILLDGSKNTLFMFGHGRLEITTPQGKKTLKERNTVWFSYENAKLTQLTHDQFVAKNNGTNW